MNKISKTPKIKDYIWYLIGDKGYLGSEIREFILENEGTIISQKKDEPLLSANDLPDNTIVMYMAAPNQKEDLQDGIKVSKEYQKIAESLKLFKYVFYFNSEICIMQEPFYFHEPDHQKNYIDNNILMLNEPYVHLMIPYVYSEDLLHKKPFSFYSKIKLGKDYNFENYRVLPIINKDNWKFQTIEKIKKYLNYINTDAFVPNFRYIETYNSNTIKLNNFVKMVKKGTI